MPHVIYGLKHRRTHAFLSYCTRSGAVVTANTLSAMRWHDEKPARAQMQELNDSSPGTWALAILSDPKD